MSLLDRISIDPEVVHGRPAIRGTRMRVTDVLSLLAAGADEAEILEDYPYLTSEDIKACLAYAAAQADHAIVIVHVTEEHVLAINRADVLAKIPEHAVDRYRTMLNKPGDIVLSRVEGATWRSRCTLRTSSSQRLEEWPEAYDAPPLVLREYADITCAPRQLVYRDNVVLPDSYNRIAAPRLRSSVLIEAGPSFVFRPDLATPARLPGRWFHLDNIMRGHFGHAMTEQLSHLWGWAEAKRCHPDLRLLVFTNRGDTIAPWELELLEAAGIPRSDVHFEQLPVRVDALVTATPMLSRPTMFTQTSRRSTNGLGRLLHARQSTGSGRQGYFFRAARQSVAATTPQRSSSSSPTMASPCTTPRITHWQTRCSSSEEQR